MGEEKRVLRLAVEAIRPNPRQPRRLFDEGALRDLAASIRRHGVLQPLVVRRRPDGWELVAGERRLRAARLAGLAAVPCIEAEVDERESALLALVENLQRQDLHYFEEAAAISDYLRRTGATQEEAAAQLGRSAPAVANKLRLLRLSPACQALLLEHGLTERHARALLRLEDEEERLAALRRAVERQLNVAQTEQYIERRLQELQTSPPAGRRMYIIKDVRLFLNSVDRGIRMVRDAGVNARCTREDTEEEIVMTIRIPRRGGTPPGGQAP
ncbi:ParB/RepB/Spo0J family partition protein [Oscillospiraceae bacterium 38-13]